MAYPPILTDVNKRPIPQVWDPTAGVWRPLVGTENGQRAQLLGSDGQPINPVSGETLKELIGEPVEDPVQYTLLSRVKELETELSNIKTALTNGTQKTTLTGHIQEFAVSSWDEIAPDEVPAGSVAILIGTNDIRQTDGKEWLPI